jgi:hypothetical protein
MINEDDDHRDVDTGNKENDENDVEDADYVADARYDDDDDGDAS